MARVVLIIPAWNAEKEIEATVRSVFAQTHQDLRVLVVDDGSTDATPDILARLAAEDARLEWMRVPNGGPAEARNRALDRLAAGAARPDYVMFLDADDRLLPDALAYALDGAAQGAELVLFGFSIVGVDGSVRDYCEPAALLDRSALSGALGRLYKANLLNQVWAKLFRADLILENGIRFPDYRWGEDRLFIFDCLERVRRVAVLPECKYRYLMHEGESLITKYYDRKFAVCLEIDRRMERLCRLLGVTEDADFRYMFAKSVFSCLTTLYAPSCPLSAAEKRAAAAEIIGSEQVRSRCEGAAGGLPVKLLCALMRTGSVPLNLAAFRGVALAGQRAPALFMKLKHRK